jgi:hypothetical protein
MRYLSGLMLSSGLAFAGATYAADPPAPACNLPAPAQPVARVAQLPAEVHDLLLSNGPVSDPGGPFNGSDVIDESAQPVPGQRLVAGQASQDAICLQVEQGGRGLHHAILQFQRRGGHWTLVSQKNQLPGAAR